MPTTLSIQDEIFAEQFKACAIDPKDFDHEAHLRLAWIHLRKYGVATAIENICAQLSDYTTHLGAADKYNKTLTVAAVKAVCHFMGKSQSDNFEDFIKEFPRLKHNFKDLMAAHYGFDIYHSAKAKTAYLEPDLLPFD